jgi:hypothetical protein
LCLRAGSWISVKSFKKQWENKLKEKNVFAYKIVFWIS